MKNNKFIFYFLVTSFFFWNCATVEVEEPILQIRGTSVITDLNEMARLSSDAIFPSVSFDGNLVAFVGDSEAFDSEARNWDLYVMDSRGGSISKLTEDKELIWERNPCWTPDNKIIYDSDYTDYINIWMRPYRGGGGSSKLTSDYPHAFYPTVSSDGKKIAYTIGGYDDELSYLNSFNVYPQELDEYIDEWYYQGEDQPPQIWILDTQTGSRIFLTEGIHPCFNPREDKIAFSKLSAGTMEIWTINIDGSNLKKLISTGGHDIEPCWAPSGRNLAFVSGISGYWKIWFIKGNEGFPVQVTAGESSEGHPSWGRGGFLYFHSDSGFDGITKIWKAKIIF